MLLDGDRLVASTDGYLYRLDPLAGTIRWPKPLGGYGVGVITPAGQDHRNLDNNESTTTWT